MSFEKNDINEPENLLKFINGELKPKKKEKKENGEVFTPLFLVNEMLDKLDESYEKEYGKSIFTEPSFKWLDPAVGIGNFLIIVYQRLMKGLQLPEEERKKHILENMLYASEISLKNIIIYKKIFCSDSYNLNIHEGDTLKMNMFEKFDVILGNPPFQEKIGPIKTETIWNKFILKSFTLLKTNGYLVLIHPSGWRNINGKFKNIQKEILSRELQYLEIHNEKDGVKTFNSETRYDWYVLKNRTPTMNTVIKFQDEITSININEMQFIPNGEYEKIMSMIATCENVNVLYSRSLYGTDKSWMSRTQTEKHCYPCVYTVNSKGVPTFFYSSKQNGHFGIPKLIWSNGGNPGSYLDINGEYGITQFAYAIVDAPENLQKIKNVFDSKIFRNLMELSTLGQGHINYKIVSILKKDFWEDFTN
jgi:hypothetical protein